MRRLARMTYKLLVTSMIAITLSFFVVTSYSHANRFQDLLTSDGFYYTGTQEGNLTANKGIFENIIHALSEIAGYLLGIMGLAIRGVGIGWIEIAEMILTSILNTENSFFGVVGGALDNYSQNVINVETIIFNKVETLNANIFEVVDMDTDNIEEEIDKDPNLTEEEKQAKKKEEKKKASENVKIAMLIRTAVAKWYYVLRLISIAFMLVLLIFIGIKMAISTIASEKAIYKQMLVDWVVGMILVFSIHYIMLVIFSINDTVVEALEPLLTESEKQEILEEYQYGLESSITTKDMETTLYESARTRAYSLNVIDGFTGMVIYGVLVYYAWRFAIMYIIRVFNVMILTLVAPVIAASYAINKVITGKSKIFSGWLNEYVMTVIIQIFHVIIYVSFVSMALQFSMVSLPGVIVAFVLLNFMLKADKMLRSIFKLVGGKGSLTGDMENIGFKEIQDKAKGLSNAVVGGKLGKEAMKLTYRIASKPLRSAVEAGFVEVMKHKAEKNDEAERKEQEEMGELEMKQQEREEEIARQKKQLEEEEQERRTLLQERGWSTVARDRTGEQIAKGELQDLETAIAGRKAAIQEEEEKLADLKDEIEYRKELTALNNMQGDLMDDTFVGNIKTFFDPKAYVQKDARWHMKAKRDKNGDIVKDRNGKRIHYYVDGKYRRRKTVRQGGIKGLSLRKKQYSVGKQFMENLKWTKILGISSASEKELKKEFKFWKNSILGVFASVAGWPTFVMNPTVGLALLGNAATSKLDFATRVRKVKNRPSYKKDKNYVFNAFSSGAQRTMQLELGREIWEAGSKITKKNGRRHPDLADRIIHNKPIRLKGHIHRKFSRYMNRPSGISVIEQEKLLEISQKEFRKKFKNTLQQLNQREAELLADEYREKFEAEEKEQRADVQKKSIRELSFADKMNDDNVVQVGNKLFEVDFKDDLEVKQDEFLEKIEKIEDSTGISRKDKIERMRLQIRQKKDDLIQNQITKYFSDRGIVDITNTSMSDKDVVQIKDNLIAVLEAKGIIKRGEIKAEDNLISSRNIQNVYQKMTENAQQTNEMLEKRVAVNGCLEYMQRNGIQDASKLQTDEAKLGIYDVIKEKMLSEASKKSAEVIRKISGQDKKKDEIELSDRMKRAVTDGTDSVEEVNVTGRNQDKKKLEDREINRRTNRTKAKVEEAVCADTTANLENKKQLELAFLISKIGSTNVEAERLGKKAKSVTNEDRIRIENYQETNRDGALVFDRQRDGSRRWNPKKDGSQKVVDQLKMDALGKILYAQENLIDVINSG